MRSVLMNRPLELQERSQMPDGGGGSIGGWATLGTLWAEIRPGRGRESGRDGVRSSRVPMVIRVRAAPHGAVDRPVAGQRFRDGQRVFRILAVAEADASGRLLRCFCEEEGLL